MSTTDGAAVGNAAVAGAATGQPEEDKTPTVNSGVASSAAGQLGGGERRADGDEHQGAQRPRGRGESRKRRDGAMKPPTFWCGTPWG